VALLAALAVLLTLVWVPALPAVAGTTTRVAGSDRIATSVAVARFGWDSADTVVVARADDPSDALAGSALAGALGAPMLITPKAGLDPAVAEEVRRLGARRAFVLGGTAALSERVVSGLRAAGVGTVTRIAGQDRFDTAGRIAAELGTPSGGTALLVGGWADALGVSGFAAQRAAAGTPWPVLVTGDRVPAATLEALHRLDVRRVVIVGGPAAVTPEVEMALAHGGFGVDRVGGPTRYATSRAVAELAATEGVLVTATGDAFPDGLAAGPLAAKLGGTFLLVPSAPTPESVTAWFDLARRHDEPVVIGGQSAVPAGTADRLSAIVRGEERRHVVRVEPGDDLAEIVADNPPGTVYRLAAGVHRGASVRPEDGDAFVGEPGAVLSGARDLSAGAVSWYPSGGAWYVTGQRQSRAGTGEIASGGNHRHRRPEELFVDDERYEHVGSRDQLGPGRWFFDYPADRIWIGEDPSRLGRIETSVTEYAFSGEEVRDVVIDNVIVEKYANVTGRGAINGHRTTNWVVRNCTARWNHGPGVSIGPGMQLSGCDIHGNGQIGLNGSCTYRHGPREGATIPAAISGNRIHHNAVLDFSWNWEAGALKIARCSNGVRFENNWVHDNDGPGPWFDGYNRQAVVRSNLVERNAQRGIFYEISSQGRIFWNTVRDNAVGVEPAVEAPGIFISNSDHTSVFQNVVSGSPSGVVARSAADREPHVTHLRVHDNDVAYTGGRTGLNVDRGEPFDAYTVWGNSFYANTYRLPDLEGRWFLWGDDRAKTPDQWRRLGQDSDGTFLVGTEAGSLPPHAVAFEPGTYGAR
jgi:putative cell wall-binding protein